MDLNLTEKHSLVKEGERGKYHTGKEKWLQLTM